MIPSNRWFPSTLQDREAWFQNFQTQLTNLGASLGFTPGEIITLSNDAAWMQFHALVATAIDSYTEAVRAFRKNQTEGDIGDPALTWPADITFTPPGPIVALPGIFERADKAVKRIRSAPNYTPEIGALFQIVPSGSPDLPENEMKPLLKVSAMPGSVVNVAFTRGKTDGVAIETRIDNATDWTGAGSFFRSPALLNIPDGTGLPHSVQIRGRYIIGNSPVGLNSDTVTVATTP